MTFDSTITQQLSVDNFTKLISDNRKSMVLFAKKKEKHYTFPSFRECIRIESIRAVNVGVILSLNVWTCKMFITIEYKLTFSSIFKCGITFKRILRFPEHWVLKSNYHNLIFRLSKYVNTISIKSFLVYG